jgi:hypothetical protein
MTPSSNLFRQFERARNEMYAKGPGPPPVSFNDCAAQTFNHFMGRSQPGLRLCGYTWNSGSEVTIRYGAETGEI